MTSSSTLDRSSFLEECWICDLDSLVRPIGLRLVAEDRTPTNPVRIGENDLFHLWPTNYSCDRCYDKNDLPTKTACHRVRKCASCLLWLCDTCVEPPPPPSRQEGTSRRQSRKSRRRNDDDDDDDDIDDKLEEQNNNNNDELPIDNINAAITCRRCANLLARRRPILDCGFTSWPARAVLRRIVFVLEPSASRNWPFDVGHGMLKSICGAFDVGSVLVYAIRCGTELRSWCAACRVVQEFARDPRRLLPHGTKMLIDATCTIDVVLGAHAERRSRAADPVALQIQAGTRVDDKTVTAARWLNEISKTLFDTGDAMMNPPPISRTAPLAHGSTVWYDSAKRMRIESVYVMACKLFPSDKAGERVRKAMRRFAKNNRLTVTACDGDVQPFVQVVPVLASYILSSICGNPIGNGVSFDVPICRISPDGKVNSIARPEPKATPVEPADAVVDAIVERLSSDPATISEPKRKKRCVQRDSVDGWPTTPSARSAYLVDETDKDTLLRCLVARWPFDVDSPTIAESYRRLFDCVALVQRIDDIDGVLIGGGSDNEKEDEEEEGEEEEDSNDVGDEEQNDDDDDDDKSVDNGSRSKTNVKKKQLHNNLARKVVELLNGSAKSGKVGKKISFLRRLKMEGMLASDDDDNVWSLERAVCVRCILRSPPSLRDLERHFSGQLAWPRALPKLRIAWRRLDDERLSDE